MSLPLSAKVTLAALLGLSVALPVALAAPTKPAPAGKTPAAAPVGASLSAIEEAADKAEQESSTALRRKRYEAVAAYVKASPTAKDASEAQVTAMNLAEELEDWANVVEHADAWIAKNKDGASKMDVLVTRVGALGHLGKNDEAKKAWADLVEGLDLEKQGAQVCWTVRSGQADFLAGMGDIEGAKKAYQDAKDKMSAVNGVNEAAEAALKGLESIGTEPTAFPDDAKDLDEKAVTLADFKGKVLLIDFWATWCGPCRAELPNVIKAYEKYHAKGFEVLGSLDKPGDTEKLKAFISAKKMPWRQCYYPADHNKVAEAYEVSGIPHTVLIGKDGKIVRIGLRGEALDRTLERLFAAK